jgi:hypothetical protein
VTDKLAHSEPGASQHQIVVPVSASLKAFIEQQARAEGKTAAQILLAAFQRTYNPRSADRGISEQIDKRKP